MCWEWGEENGTNLWIPASAEAVAANSVTSNEADNMVLAIIDDRRWSITSLRRNPAIFFENPSGRNSRTRSGVVQNHT
jgi:hypothetical protein